LARHVCALAWDGSPVPPRTVDSAGHREEGTASVELVAVVPFLLLAVLVAVQIALAGQALWSAGVAARAGARAALVGSEVTAAARRALPPSLRQEARVEEAGDVSVRVAVPRLFPGLPQVMVGARAELGPGDG
jgi:Flp pilus assembly protein TadG